MTLNKKSKQKVSRPRRDADADACGYVILLTDRTRLGAPLRVVSRPFGRGSKYRKPTQDPTEAAVFARESAAERYIKRMYKQCNQYTATVLPNRARWGVKMRRRRRDRSTPLLDAIEAEPTGATPGPPGTFSAAPTAPLKAPSGPSVGATPDWDALTEPERRLEFYRSRMEDGGLSAEDRLYWRRRYEEEQAERQAGPKARRKLQRRPPTPPAAAGGRLYPYEIRRSQLPSYPVIDRVYAPDPEAAVSDIRRLRPELRAERIFAAREASLSLYYVTDQTGVPEGQHGPGVFATYTYSEREAVEYTLEKRPELLGRDLRATRSEKP